MWGPGNRWLYGGLGMKVGVTKQQLIKSLEETLKLTNNDVERLELIDRVEPEDTVMIHFIGGGKRLANIACDSGIAIIRDVCRVF